MGKTTTWLKGIFGMKSSTKDQKEPGIINSNSGDRKRSSFGNSGRDSGTCGRELCNNPATVPPNISPSEAAWLRSYYLESDKEQSKHAIAVAAATAAAADAAVAAAQAAVAVVRLTRHGHGTMFAAGRSGGRVKWAAVKIQTTFRGYLARKALRALKGLVRIQALVRGYLVRKQATATLLGMQALIRAQATVRSKKAQAQAQAQFANHQYSGLSNQEFKARKSMKEIFDDTSCEHKASIHSRRLSASSFESKNINPTIEDIPKIVEVDPGRPRCSKVWRPNFLEPRPEYGEHDPFYPAWPENEWGLMGDHEYRASTAQSTPRFINTGGPNPSKSVCGDNNSYNFFGQCGNFHIAHPNYMANTMSFRAKVRSQSAPKQRVEPGYSKKRLSLNEMMESRNSLSGVGMQRSCCHVQEAISFKNVVMGKLNRSYEFGREVDRYHLQRKY